MNLESLIDRMTAETAALRAQDAARPPIVWIEHGKRREFELAAFGVTDFDALLERADRKFGIDDSTPEALRRWARVKGMR